MANKLTFNSQAGANTNTGGQTFGSRKFGANYFGRGGGFGQTPIVKFDELEGERRKVYGDAYWKRRDEFDKNNPDNLTEEEIDNFCQLFAQDQLFTWDEKRILGTSGIYGKQVDENPDFKPSIQFDKLQGDARNIYGDAYWSKRDELEAGNKGFLGTGLFKLTDKQIDEMSQQHAESVLKGSVYGDPVENTYRNMLAEELGKADLTMEDYNAFPDNVQKAIRNIYDNEYYPAIKIGNYLRNAVPIKWYREQKGQQQEYSQTLNNYNREKDMLPAVGREYQEFGTEYDPESMSAMQDALSALGASRQDWSEHYDLAEDYYKATGVTESELEGALNYQRKQQDQDAQKVHDLFDAGNPENADFLAAMGREGVDVDEAYYLRMSDAAREELLDAYRQGDAALDAWADKYALQDPEQRTDAEKEARGAAEPAELERIMRDRTREINQRLFMSRLGNMIAGQPLHEAEINAQNAEDTLDFAKNTAVEAGKYAGKQYRLHYQMDELKKQMQPLQDELDELEKTLDISKVKPKNEKQDTPGAERWWQLHDEIDKLQEQYDRLWEQSTGGAFTRAHNDVVKFRDDFFSMAGASLQKGMVMWADSMLSFVDGMFRQGHVDDAASRWLTKLIYGGSEEKNELIDKYINNYTGKLQNEMIPDWHAAVQGAASETQKVAEMYGEELHPAIMSALENVGVPEADREKIAQFITNDIMISGGENYGRMMMSLYMSAIGGYAGGGYEKATSIGGAVKNMALKIGDVFKNPGFWDIFATETGEQMQDVMNRTGNNPSDLDLLFATFGGMQSAIIELYETSWGSQIHTKLLRGMPSSGIVGYFKDTIGTMAQETYEECAQHFTAGFWSDMADILQGRNPNAPLNTYSKNALFNAAEYLDIAKQTMASTAGMSFFTGTTALGQNFFRESVEAVLNGTATAEQQEAAARAAALAATQETAEHDGMDQGNPNTGSPMNPDEGQQHNAFAEGLGETAGQQQDNGQLPAAAAETVAAPETAPAPEAAITPEEAAANREEIIDALRKFGVDELTLQNVREMDLDPQKLLDMQRAAEDQEKKEQDESDLSFWAQDPELLNERMAEITAENEEIKKQREAEDAELRQIRDRQEQDARRQRMLAAEQAAQQRTAQQVQEDQALQAKIRQDEENRAREEQAAKARQEEEARRLRERAQQKEEGIQAQKAREDEQAAAERQAELERLERESEETRRRLEDAKKKRGNGNQVNRLQRKLRDLNEQRERLQREQQPAPAYTAEEVQGIFDEQSAEAADARNRQAAEDAAAAQTAQAEQRADQEQYARDEQAKREALEQGQAQDAEEIARLEAEYDENVKRDRENETQLRDALGDRYQEVKDLIFDFEHEKDARERAKINKQINNLLKEAGRENGRSTDEIYSLVDKYAETRNEVNEFYNRYDQRMAELRAEAEQYHQTYQEQQADQERYAQDQADKAAAIEQGQEEQAARDEQQADQERYAQDEQAKREDLAAAQMRDRQEIERLERVRDETRRQLEEAGKRRRDRDLANALQRKLDDINNRLEQLQQEQPSPEYTAEEVQNIVDRQGVPETPETEQTEPWSTSGLEENPAIQTPETQDEEEAAETGENPATTPPETREEEPAAEEDETEKPEQEEQGQTQTPETQPEEDEEAEETEGNQTATEPEREEPEEGEDDTAGQKPETQGEPQTPEQLPEQTPEDEGDTDSSTGAPVTRPQNNNNPGLEGDAEGAKPETQGVTDEPQAPEKLPEDEGDTDSSTGTQNTNNPGSEGDAEGAPQTAETDENPATDTPEGENPAAETPEAAETDENPAAETGEETEEQKSQNARKVARNFGLNYLERNGTPRAGVNIRTWSSSVSRHQASQVSYRNSGRTAMVDMADLKAIDEYAKKRGIAVVIDDTIDNSTKNGYYQQTPGNPFTVHIAQDAENPLRTVFGHELYHAIVANNPAAARSMQQAWLSYAQRAGLDMAAEMQKIADLYKKNGLPVPPAAVLQEEVIANSLYDIIGDQRTMQVLAAQNRGMVQQIRNWVSKVLQDIRSIVGKYADRDAGARMLRDTEGAMENMRRMIDQALERSEAVDHSKKAVKSLGENGPMTKRYQERMEKAENRQDANRATRQLAQDLLRRMGIEASAENVNKMLNAALDFNAGRVAMSSALQRAGFPAVTMDAEMNRAFGMLAKYMDSIMGRDTKGYMELMKGEPETATEQQPQKPREPAVRKLKRGDDVKLSLKDMQKLTWDQQMDRYYRKNGQNPSRSDVFEIAKAEDVREIGLDAPIVIKQETLNKGTREIDESKSKSAHHVSEKNIRNLSAAVKNPVAKIESDRGIVIVTDLTETAVVVDKNGNTVTYQDPVIVPINKAIIDGQRVYRALTVYGRENMPTLYGNWESGLFQAFDSVNITTYKENSMDILLGRLIYNDERQAEVHRALQSIIERSKSVKYSVKENATAEQDAAYMEAVEKGDTEAQQKLVDQAAKDAGYIPVKRYHQTGERFTKFNTDRPAAGLNDSETPNGIFFKENDHDIGVGADFIKLGHGGDVQMEVYLKAENMLHFSNREEANRWYCEHVDGYEELQAEMNRVLKEKYLTKLDAINDEFFKEETTPERYSELDEQEDRLIEEMSKEENKYRAQLRELLNKYFLNGNSVYDGIELDDDGHRYINGEREDVHTFIVFNPSQVKSADPVTYDDQGKVIPLSERFNPENEDIRWSMKVGDSVTQLTRDLEKTRDADVTLQTARALTARLLEANDTDVNAMTRGQLLSAAMAYTASEDVGQALEGSDLNIQLTKQQDVSALRAIGDAAVRLMEQDPEMYEALFTEETPEEAKERKKAARAQAKARTADEVADAWQVRADYAGTDQNAHELIVDLVDAITNIRTKATMDQDGRVIRQTGHWKAAVPTLARAIQQSLGITMSEDTVKRTVREALTNMDEELARGVHPETALDNCLNMTLASLTDLYMAELNKNSDRAQITKDALNLIRDKVGSLVLMPTERSEVEAAAEDGLKGFRKVMSGVVDVRVARVNKETGTAVHTTGQSIEDVYKDEDVVHALGLDPDLANPGDQVMDLCEKVRALKTPVGRAAITTEETDMLHKVALNLVASYFTSGENTTVATSTAVVTDERHQEVLRQAEQLEKEVSEKQDELMMAQAELSALTEKYDAVVQNSQNVYNTLMQERKANVPAAQLEELRNQMLEAQQNEAQAQKDLKAAEKKLKDLQKKQTERQQKLRNLQKQLRAQEKQNEKQQRQMDRMLGRIDRLNNQILMEKNKVQQARAKAKAQQNRQASLDNIRKQGTVIRKMLAQPGQKTGYVPQEYVRPVADFVQALSENDGRKSAEMGKRVRDMVRDAQTSSDYAAQQLFAGGLSDMVDQSIRLLEDKGALRNLTDEELRLVETTIAGVVGQLRDMNKYKSDEIKQERLESAAEAIGVLNKNPRAHRGAAGVASNILLQHMNAERVFNMLAHHDNNVFSQMNDMFRNGYRVSGLTRMNMTKHFEHLTTGENAKKFDRFAGKNATLYDTPWMIIDHQGNDTGRMAQLTAAQRVSLWFNVNYEQNLEGMRAGMKRDGQDLYQLTLPDQTLLKKGKIDQAYKEGDRVYFTLDEAKAVLDEMTDYDMEWVKAYQAMEQYSKGVINDTSLRLKNYRLATVEDYFPIRRDSNFTQSDFQTVVVDNRLENQGWTKSRVNAHNPMLLMDVTQVVNSQIQGVSDYVGYAIPIRDFTMFMNTTLGNNADSVKAAIARTQGTEMIKYLDQLMGDLQGTNRTENTWLDNLRGKTAAATLTLNVGVMTKQMASYPAAAAIVGWKPLMKAMGSFVNRKNIDPQGYREIYTSGYWERQNMKLSDMEANANRNTPIKRGLHKIGNGIQAFDLLTTDVLWQAAKYYVEDTTDLRPGTEEEIKSGQDPYMQKVGDVYNQMLEQSQPEYNVWQRPAILRSKSQAVKMLTMYKTQSVQNFGLVVDAFGQLKDAHENLKANDNEETRAAYEQAKRQVAKTVSSQVVSAVMLAVLTMLGKAIFHRMKDYKDEKGDITAASAGKQIAKDTASSIAGMVVGGSELYDLIVGLMEGKAPYDIEAAGISTLNDMYQNTYGLFSGAQVIGDADLTPEEKMQKLAPRMRKFAGSLAQLLGIPLDNAIKLVDGIATNAKEFAIGKPLSFEEGGFLGAAQGRETSNADVAGYIAQAMMDGNTAEAERLYNGQLAQGKTPEAINTAIANWQKANIPEIREAAEAIENGDVNLYNALIKEITQKGISTANAVKYVESERKKMQKAEEAAKAPETEQPAAGPQRMTYEQITAGMTKEASEQLYTNGMMNSLLEDGNVQQAMVVRDAMLEAGKKQSAISSSLSNYWKPILLEAYEAGDMMEVKRITDMLVSMGMKRSTIQGWTGTKSSSSKKSAFGKSSFGSGAFGKSAFGSGTFGSGSFGKTAGKKSSKKKFSGKSF